MRFLTTIFQELPPEYHKSFRKTFHVLNAKRLYGICWLGMVLLVPVVILDWVRFRDGFYDDPSHLGLFFSHYTLAFLVIPLLFYWKNMDGILRFEFPRIRVVNYATLLYIGFSLLFIAFLSILDRGDISLYAVLAIIMSLAIVVPHMERIVLFSGALIVIMIPFFYTQNNPSEVMLGITEAIAVTIPSFLFSTFQYNQRIKDYLYEQTLTEKNRIIAEEQKRANDLLFNILPSSIARELIETGYSNPHFFDSATIMFTDFRKFSNIAETLPPWQLLEDLNYCFKAFDAIIEQNQLEKIKTIGDSYMCVGGVPGPHQQHARATVQAALEMQEFLQVWNKERVEQELPIYEMRIGIHTGSVVAGVIGAKKMIYDIWGDAVNITSRLERSSEPGKVNISGVTYSMVRHYFQCDYRGKISFKHVREMDMYFVDNKTD